MQGSRQTALSLVFPPPAQRCPTPVRRRSYFKGRSEGRIWQATTRKDVQAILKAAEIYNEAGQIVLAYKLYRCWPSEFSAFSDMDASASAIAIQTLKLENEGWERDEDVTEPEEPSFELPA